MDTKKAFDTINHEYIFEVLERIGLPSWVVQLVRGLLQEVKVSPVLGGDTGVWINITRGVKQGCPLSPLLFAICYDPLVCKLDEVVGIDVFAFADDVALGGPKLGPFGPAQEIIDSFQAVTGQAKNEDKTAIVSAKGDKAVSWIANSRWPRVKFRSHHTYLGVIIGRDITTRDIYARAAEKFTARIMRYRKALKALSLVHRVIAVNVFCVTVFSYLMHFASFPMEDSKGGRISLHDKITGLISRTLIPMGGTAFKMVHLTQPRTRVSPQPELKDIWALSTSILAEKSRLEEWEGCEVVPGYASNSMRQSVMIKATASDAIAFHLGAYYPDEGDAVFKASHFESEKVHLLPLAKQSMIAWSMQAIMRSKTRTFKKSYTSADLLRQGRWSITFTTTTVSYTDSFHTQLDTHNSLSFLTP